MVLGLRPSVRQTASLPSEPECAMTAGLPKVWQLRSLSGIRSLTRAMAVRMNAMAPPRLWPANVSRMPWGTSSRHGSMSPHTPSAMPYIPRWTTTSLVPRFRSKKGRGQQLDSSVHRARRSTSGSRQTTPRMNTRRSTPQSMSASDSNLRFASAPSSNPDARPLCSGSSSMLASPVSGLCLAITLGRCPWVTNQRVYRFCPCASSSMPAASTAASSSSGGTVYT
mmetsp:Transcript_20745/g.54207  ORF Transcript_20745/g.54207 Transcript_20745/m.54207 type:complete len:224 (-) Transcript_20745:152-823(-)